MFLPLSDIVNFWKPILVPFNSGIWNPFFLFFFMHASSWFLNNLTNKSGSKSVIRLNFIFPFLSSFHSGNNFLLKKFVYGMKVYWMFDGKLWLRNKVFFALSENENRLLNVPIIWMKGHAALLIIEKNTNTILGNGWAKIILKSRMRQYQILVYRWKAPDSIGAGS